MRQFVAYLDESGDEGFQFATPPKRASSEWFVLSAIVHDVVHVQQIKDHYAEFKARHRKPDAWFFHLANTNHDARMGFLSHMVQLPVHAMTVLVHKPSLTKPDNFQRPYYLYFYAAKLLLERLSWFAASDGGVARMILSSRRGLTLSDFRQYMAILKSRTVANRLLNQHSIKWAALDLVHSEVRANKDLRCLQLADGVASGVAKAVEWSEYGTTEDRYAQIIRPIIYKRSGTYRSYGLKFFPTVPDSLMLEPRMSWLSMFK
ncbi:DUF3800 domain-containing protein [Thalassobaculum sp.]|uniref:DUF3800 domain-containing protein n=1 Tax=Thalassobaculum sp. TaxID=2022740 RepID=UPI0032EEB1D7